MGFKLFAYGLWFGLIYLTMMAIGETLSPGSLKGTASTDLGILIVFCMIVLDSHFTLGSVE